LKRFGYSNYYTLQNNIFSGLFVGQNLVTLKEVDSTNNYLKDLLSNSKPVVEGTVIMAEAQYAGRGQQQNKWLSEPGKNLTFSLLLKPSFLPVNQQFDLTRAISLGVIDALKPHFGEHVKIKWPNDIYINDRKLGGMLIENLLQGSSIKHSVVGIGLNVNQVNFPEGAANPISFKQILHKDYDLQTILLEICKNIEVRYLQLKAGKTELIRSIYTDSLLGLNDTRHFKSNGIVFIGIITGVTPEGLLKVKQNDTEMLYNLKEIEFIKDRS